MLRNLRSRYRLPVLSFLVLLLVSAGCGGGQVSEPAASKSSASTAPSGSAATAGTRTVTDTDGRVVTIPARVNRVATVGGVPALNTWIFVVGEEETIVNGLPPFAQTPRWKYQTVFAPNTANQPVMQGADGVPNLEELLKAKPDVIVAHTSELAATLEKTGIPVVVIRVNTIEHLKGGVRLMGEVFDQQARADAYLRYVDETVRRVQDGLAAVPEDARPSVLFVNMKPLRRPNMIMEWVFEQSGAKSVTGDQTVPNFQFSVEQLLQWNPDFIIGSNANNITQLKTNPQFQELKAVTNNRIALIPSGAHPWGNGSTTETPLALLWTAKQLYPDQFKDLDIAAEVTSFYQTYYGTTLTADQVHDILSGIEHQPMS